MPLLPKMDSLGFNTPLIYFFICKSLCSNAFKMAKQPFCLVDLNIKGEASLVSKTYRPVYGTGAIREYT
ncbi:hypothetical protein PSKAS_18220 [Peribacillus sp. N1]